MFILVSVMVREDQLRKNRSQYFEKLWQLNRADSHGKTRKVMVN